MRGASRWRQATKGAAAAGGNEPPPPPVRQGVCEGAGFVWLAATGAKMCPLRRACWQAAGRLAAQTEYTSVPSPGGRGGAGAGGAGSQDAVSSDTVPGEMW